MASVARPVGSGVFAHDALHGRIGFQRGGIHAHGLAAQQAPLVQQAQHLVKHGIKHGLGQALANDRHRGMDRHRIGPGLLPWFASSQCHAHHGRAALFARYRRKRFLTGC
ncbi:MAG: hypothetical protein EBT61_21445 [Verrucomicrobia bacterium]|nr:hypothetical protein [Verrucomicrobiota bacterium]